MAINTTQAFVSSQETVADTALTLADMTFTAAQVALASRLKMIVRANAVNVRWDGTAPTTAAGYLVDASGVATFTLEGNQNISNFQAIRNGGSSATVFIVLEQ